jgi:AmmeMemoRadiSam system protein A
MLTMLDVDEQQRLLMLARRALDARVRGEEPPVIEDTDRVGVPAGAFVTIHRADHLRGCLGRLECDSPLDHVVVHLATIVADSDPRFPPVTAEELAEIEIEISVLTQEREIQSLDEIEIGRHGLVVERGGRRGLLLPQVASDHGFGVTTFVEHTCRKAGLPPDAWRYGARLFVFEALVFEEQPA